jgi:hypothetical protein
MSRKAAVTGLFVTVIGVSLLFVAHARPGRTSAGETQSASDRVEAELLVLRSDGFRPNEITRPPGRFLLILQNHSSEEELSLVLKQETGASVRELRMPKRQSKLKDFLHLPPGRYVLAETNHSEWTCTITITQ